MPETERQRRAACAEMGRRKKGKAGGKGRPFGSASMDVVLRFCRGKRHRRRKKKR